MGVTGGLGLEDCFKVATVLDHQKGLIFPFHHPANILGKDEQVVGIAVGRGALVGKEYICVYN